MRSHALCRLAAIDALAELATVAPTREWRLIEVLNCHGASHEGAQSTAQCNHASCGPVAGGRDPGGCGSPPCAPAEPALPSAHGDGPQYWCSSVAGCSRNRPCAADAPGTAGRDAQHPRCLMRLCPCCACAGSPSPAPLCCIIHWCTLPCAHPSFRCWGRHICCLRQC